MSGFWSRLMRRVLCCGPGASAPGRSARISSSSASDSCDEPIYQNLETRQQESDAAQALRLLVEAVDEMKEVLIPIADMPDRMRRLEMNLHPLLRVRPGDDEYLDMSNARPPAAARPPEPPRSCYLDWFQERHNYDDPWWVQERFDCAWESW